MCTERALRLVAATALAIVAGCTPLRIASWAGMRGWYLAGSEADERVPLSPTSPGCDALRAQIRDPALPVWVLVPGIQGEGAEWDLTRDVIAPEAAAVYLWRWVPYDERDRLVADLAQGIGRLRACLPDVPRIVILAHSAGGVIASFAAASLPGDRPPVTLATTASPLGGVQPRARNPDGEAEARFILDLGSAIETYPPAGPGVEVVHYRTFPPDDPVMAPRPDGVSPNARTVPGAEVVDLPGLGHDAAVAEAARRLVARLHAPPPT